MRHPESWASYKAGATKRRRRTMRRHSQGRSVRDQQELQLSTGTESTWRRRRSPAKLVKRRGGETAPTLFRSLPGSGALATVPAKSPIAKTEPGHSD
ncbi:hypothetical protein DFH06DRAFT_1337364 [Mycena polygramma]|nr:hypothetical protein DFH06DRAFT_1337364 [Mycena polygramma]